MPEPIPIPRAIAPKSQDVDPLPALLLSQFEAALCTLHLAVTRCPDAGWTTPVAAWPFGQAAFHAVFFGDLYLQPTDDVAALKRQPFHAAHAADFAAYPELADPTPPTAYAKPFVMTYLAFVRTKVRQTLTRETPSALAGPSGFRRRPCTRAELHVDNLRHLQHHAAQLSLRLRLDHGIDIPWVGHGWEED